VKQLIFIFVALLISGCVASNSPKLEILSDNSDERKIHFQLISQSLKGRNFFSEYIFSQPQKLIVNLAKISKPSNFLGISGVGASAEGRSEYCVLIDMNTEADSFTGFGRLIRSFYATILRDSSNAGRLVVQFRTNPTRPTLICDIDQPVDLVELKGHIFTR
jgi:hypothetical protein